MQELEESPTGSGNAFIYGNDVDSVDIAIRVAMVRIYFFLSKYNFLITNFDLPSIRYNNMYFCLDNQISIYIRLVL